MATERECIDRALHCIAQAMGHLNGARLVEARSSLESARELLEQLLARERDDDAEADTTIGG